MGSEENTKQSLNDFSPSLDVLINTIDGQLDQEMLPHAAKGFEDLWGSQNGEYKRPDQQFIRFVVSGMIFAIPLQNSVEIDYLPDIVPLPNLPHWVLGISSLRGDLVSVVDIRHIFRLNPDDAGAVKKLILIRNEEMSTAIIVDRIQGMVFVDEHHFQSNTDLKIDKSFSAFVRSVLEMDREAVYLLDVGKLMKALEL